MEQLRTVAWNCNNSRSPEWNYDDIKIIITCGIGLRQAAKVIEVKHPSFVRKDPLPYKSKAAHELLMQRKVETTEALV